MQQKKRMMKMKGKWSGSKRRKSWKRSRKEREAGREEGGGAEEGKEVKSRW